MPGQLPEGVLPLDAGFQRGGPWAGRYFEGSELEMTQAAASMMRAFSDYRAVPTPERWDAALGAYRRHAGALDVRDPRGQPLDPFHAAVQDVITDPGNHEPVLGVRARRILSPEDGISATDAVAQVGDDEVRVVDPFYRPYAVKASDVVKLPGSWKVQDNAALLNGDWLSYWVDGKRVRKAREAVHGEPSAGAFKAFPDDAVDVHLHPAWWSQFSDSVLEQELIARQTIAASRSRQRGSEAQRRARYEDVQARALEQGAQLPAFEDLPPEEPPRAPTEFDRRNAERIEWLKRNVPSAKDYGPGARSLAGRVVLAPARTAPVIAGNVAAVAGGTAVAGPIGGVVAAIGFNTYENYGPLAHELLEMRNTRREVEHGSPTALRAMGDEGPDAWNVPLAALPKVRAGDPADIPVRHPDGRIFSAPAELAPALHQGGWLQAYPGARTASEHLGLPPGGVFELQRDGLTWKRVK